MGCTISLRTATGDTGRKAFHPYFRDRILIHVELQEDLAFKGCGRLVGCVLVRGCFWSCACSRGWLIVLHELSIVNDSIRATLALSGNPMYRLLERAKHIFTLSPTGDAVLEA